MAAEGLEERGVPLYQFVTVIAAGHTPRNGKAGPKSSGCCVPSANSKHLRNVKRRAERKSLLALTWRYCRQRT